MHQRRLTRCTSVMTRNQGGLAKPFCEATAVFADARKK
jgi:hypothetical protein